MRTSLSACWLLLAILGLPLVAQGQDVDSGVVATPAVNFAMGLPEDSPEDIAGAGEAEAPARGNVPSSIDLSTSFPAPSAQGTMGTCVGWAVANLASFHENEERRRAPTGVGPDFSPLYPYNLSKRSADNDCSMGISVAQALRVLQDQGIAPIASYHDGKGGVVLSKLTKLTITRGDGAGVLRGALTMGRLEARLMSCSG